MKKQFPKTSKHDLVPPKGLLQKINERIINTFVRIEEHEHNERAIGKELNWLALELEKNWNILNPIHIAALLNNLGNLEVDNQVVAIDIINLTLKRCTELLCNAQTKDRQITSREIAQIFNALPKLPVSYSKHKTLLSMLLTRANTLASKGNLDARDSANILGGISKLGIDLFKYRILVTHLLQVFELSKEAFSKLDLTTLSELWQFCIFARAKIASETIDKLVAFADSELKEREKERISPSLFQKTFYTLLLKLLTDGFRKKVIVEYPIGAYSLDIAFPELKLNIEIDGPYHYWDRKLKRINKFRDFILQAYDNWEVIRIPYFEWEQFDNNTPVKIDYLLEKLAHHDYLFNQQSFERLKALEPSLNIAKEDTNTIDKQMSSTPANLIVEAMSIQGIFKQPDSSKTSTVKEKEQAQKFVQYYTALKCGEK